MLALVFLRLHLVDIVETNANEIIVVDRKFCGYRPIRGGHVTYHTRTVLGCLCILDST